MSDAHQTPALARATVDVSSYVVSVPQADLLEKLRRRLRAGSPVAVRLADTFELETPEGFGATHPVVVESWRVRAGSILSMGVEQEVWARHVGSAWGAMAALAMPTAWRAAWTVATREGLATPGSAKALDAAAAELVRGAVTGASLGARGAMAVNAAAQTRFGRYGEVSVFVPFVRVAALDTSCSFVTGMFTDSRFAQTIDRMLGYGFAKQHGRILHDELGLTVDSSSGRCQLRTRDERIDADLPIAAPHHWELPLLGMSPAGGLVTSRLTRVPSAMGCGLHAQLETHDGVRWLLPEVNYRVEPVARDGIAGGMYVREVSYELSAPRNLH